jgi:hypothetical protein
MSSPASLPATATAPCCGWAHRCCGLGWAGGAEGDGVADDAPGVRVRACHDRAGRAAGGRRATGRMRWLPRRCRPGTDVIGIERAAYLMSTLLRAQVPAGFVPACLVRLDATLLAAGFEEALKDALKTGRPAGRRRVPRPADRRSYRAGGLRQPARAHGAHRAHTPAAGRIWSGTARPGPHQARRHRPRDPRRVPRDAGAGRLPQLPQLRHLAGPCPAMPGPPLRPQCEPGRRRRCPAEATGPGCRALTSGTRWA